MYINSLVDITSITLMILKSNTISGLLRVGVDVISTMICLNIDRNRSLVQFHNTVQSMREQNYMNQETKWH